MSASSLQQNSGTTVIVGETLVTLLTLDTTNIERLFFQLAVITQALDQFAINGRAATSGAALTVLKSAAGDYTTPAGILVDASGDLTAIAASAFGWFVLDTRGIVEVSVEAAAAVASASVDWYSSAIRSLSIYQS